MGDVRVDLVAILVELRGRETILLRWVVKVWGGFVGSARVRGRGGRGGARSLDLEFTREPCGRRERERARRSVARGRAAARDGRVGARTLRA